MDEPYSNRELDLLFKGQEERNIERHNDQMAVLTRIEAQTTKTNGRVTKTEEQITGLRVWRGMIVGGMGIITVVILPFVWAVISTGEIHF